MKKTFLLVLVLIITLSVNGQIKIFDVCTNCTGFRYFDFNNYPDSTLYYFSLDTSQPNNIWQHGNAQKVIFNSGYGGPKALMTDTINPYPVNNISSFEFSLRNCSENTAAQDCSEYVYTYLVITHKFDTDDSIDGGTIEVSHNGSPFVNIIDDPLVNNIGILYTHNDTVKSLGKPGFSGTLSDWQNIHLRFWSVDDDYDTITFRFTFASDSIQTNKEGWMMGLVEMEGVFTGINEIQADNLIKVYPNPVAEQLTVVPLKSNNACQIQISDFKGRVLYDNPAYNGEKIDTRKFPDGVYLLKYSDNVNYAVKKIIVKH
jgi:hypothetical protein